MIKTALHWLGHSLVVVAATAMLAACADDAPIGPERRPAPSARLGAAVAPGAASSNANRGAELGSCDNLRPDAGSKLAFHAYATGVQIYRWNGASWSFVAPSAVLSADAGGKSTVGLHYSGPTWEITSGGKLVGAVLQRCTPDSNAIPWLLLGTVSAEGPGVFQRVAFIQRVNTVGGTAPSAPGSFADELVGVPYTAEYLFYRAP